MTALSTSDAGLLYIRVHFCMLCVCVCLVCRTIKVWDLKAALDPRTPVQNLCLRTLVVSGSDEWGGVDNDSDNHVMVCIMYIILQTVYHTFTMSR